MRTILKTIAGLGLTLALCGVAMAGPDDERAIAERLAAMADRFGNAGGAAAYRQALFEASSRLAENEVRFRRQRFRAAEAAGDTEMKLATLLDWRKLEPGNLYVQMRLIDVYVERMQTADARLAYLKTIVGAESVDAEVRSHAAAAMARVYLEQSRTQLCLETLRKSLLLNGLNTDALQLQWRISAPGANSLQRINLLLAMLKASPGSVDVATKLAQELAQVNLVQASLQWYAHAEGMARVTGGFSNAVSKEYAAELLIAGQDRGAGEITAKLLERDAADSGAWFLTLLAERQMKDRIELVRKNALIGLINRLSAVRKELGAKDATTRPLGSEEVSLPNLANDAELLKNATPEQLAAYVNGVSDIAWLLVFHAEKPAEAAPLIEAIRKADPSAKTVVARLEGWSLIRSGKLPEAKAKLEPISNEDALSAMGLIKVLRQDAAGTAPAVDLTRRLTRALPWGILGAVIRSEVGDLAGEGPADPMVDAIRDALDRFPREVLRQATAPQEFLTMRLQPQQVGHDYAEPILVDVEVRNLKEMPVVIGPGGMIRDLWLDAQSRGLVQQAAQGVVFEKVDGPMLLQPGTASRWSVRLDRGPLAELLGRDVGVSLQMSVSGLTNAVPTDYAIAPGPCGIRGKMTQMLERRAASLASDAALRRARAVLDTSDQVGKIRLADQVAAHLAIVADPEGPANVKAMDAEFRDLLIRLSGDSTTSVKTWSRYRMAQMNVEPSEKTASDLGADSVWYVRLLGAAVAIDTPQSTRKTLLEKLNQDADATVRRFAASVPAALEAGQEKARENLPEQTPAK